MSKTIVLAVANQKGGVGKTTTAVNLGYALARAGHATLIVDLDPQANATVHLGINPYDVNRDGKTIYHVLHDTPFTDVIRQIADIPLHLAPSSLALAAADSELIAEPGGSQVLREKLDSIRTNFRFIIIDCPPHLGLLTVNALSAADLVLIPTQTEVLSSMGIPLLLDTIDKIRRRSNPRLDVFGILPTMHASRLTQDRATLADIHDSFGAKTRVFAEVSRSTLYPQSAAAGQATMEVAPNAPGMEVYHTLAAELIRLAIEPVQEVTHG